MNATPTHALRQLRRAHHHEIRGALNALRLQLTLLQRGREKASPDDPRFFKWVDGAAAEAGAVERALEELSAVERIDEIAGDDPMKTAQRVTELLEPLAKAHRVHLAFEPAEEGQQAAGRLPEAPGLARVLLEAGACRIVDAGPDSTLTIRVGSDGIEISPGSHHLPFDQLPESIP